LAGGNGNDKLFNGAGTAVMYGGKGANHFDCSLSALGLARSVVMDYNPSNGDTISGPCKIVNTIGNNGDSSVTLPDTKLFQELRLALSESHLACPLVSGLLK
jgi:Ca2+-binding RTX toxin-like protein